MYIFDVRTKNSHTDAHTAAGDFRAANSDKIETDRRSQYLAKT